MSFDNTVNQIWRELKNEGFMLARRSVEAMVDDMFFDGVPVSNMLGEAAYQLYKDYSDKTPPRKPSGKMPDRPSKRVNTADVDEIMDTTPDGVPLSVSGRDLTNDFHNESMIAPIRRPAPASGKKTVKRHKGGQMKGMEPNTVQVYSPLSVSMPSSGPSLKSSFNAFKKYFDGSRTLTNSFSFTMRSDQGQRGTLLIPLRTDAALYGHRSHLGGNQDNYYSFVTGQSSDVTAQNINDRKNHYQFLGSDGHRTHIVGDLVRNGKDGSTLCEPLTNRTWSIQGGPQSKGGPGILFEPGDTTIPATASGNNLLIPGMQLLHVENASWCLNAMKIIKQRQMTASDAETAKTDALLGNTAPLVVHGNWNVQQWADSRHPKFTDSYISRRWNGARQQNMLVADVAEPGGTNGYPTYSYAPYEEQYEIQAGRGSIEFTIKNEGAHQATVELVVMKPNKHCFTQGGMVPAGLPSKNSPQCAENVWSWLKSTNGVVFKQGITQKREKELQTKYASSGVSANVSTDVPEEHDIISNPYVNFLPDSSFKSRVTAANTMPVNSQFKTEDGHVNVDSNRMEYSIEVVPVQNDIFDTNAGGDTVQAGVMPKGRIQSPYSSVGRAFATVPAQSKRTVRIPLPKMRYNPSNSAEFSKLPDDYSIQCIAGGSRDIKATMLNPESLMIAMSVNGARSDYYEDTVDPKFRGIDFTPSLVYVDAVYKETVYPCVMEECKDDVAFNFGKPYGTGLGTGTYFPAQPVSAANVVSVSQTNTNGGIKPADPIPA